MASIPENDKDALPLRMGRYQLVRRLPAGGMTDVYLARVAGPVGPERLLVIKSLSRDRAKGELAEARFLEEALISLSLAHGNVTTTFETGKADDGTPFIVMEYVHGASLRELLDHGPLSPPLALLVAREVSRALRYTHTFKDIEGRTSPIAHLDVTPENILVSMAGNVKLTDFGIARAIGRASDGRVFGKAAYTAPEILAHGEGGRAADLWSLGCVLYEMISGRAPHRRADRESTLARVRSGEAPPALSTKVDLPSALAEDLDQLVGALLHPDPSERLDDAAEVERALTTVLTQVNPIPTEADLGGLMLTLFPSAKESSKRDRLRAELACAGRPLTGSESTGELLLEGTVPLIESSPDSSSTSTSSETARGANMDRPNRWSRARPFFLPAALTLLAISVALLWGWEPGTHVDEGGQEEAMVDPIVEEATPIAGEPEGELASAVKEPVSAKRLFAESRELEEDSLAGSSSATHEASIDLVRLEGREMQASRQIETSEANAETDEGQALLHINSYPYAHVLLGERKLGTTPLRGIEVPAGAHRLVFENPELGLVHHVELELVDGEERVVGVRLDR